MMRASPQARTKGSNGRWGLWALACLCPTVAAAADSVITFNEIMYHPAAADHQSLEWVEIFNSFSYDMDLSGWRLAGDVSFIFPTGTTIRTEGRLVVAQSPSALASAAGVTNALGPFDGQLANGGGTLRLLNNSGREMDMVTYADGGEWPAAPDGGGVSLAKRVPFSASEPAANWHFSAQPGGTPGAMNFPSAPPVPLVVFNELEGVTNAPWWVELVCQAPGGTNPAGYVVSVAGDPAREYAVTNTWLPEGGLLYLSAAELGFAALDEEPVFLYTPGRTAVADARVAKRRLRGHSDRYPGRWLYPVAATPGAANAFAFHDDAIINEIMYHHQPFHDGVTVTDSAEEWIELYNRGTAPIDLSGWSLDGGVGFVFAAGTTLATGAYLVVASDAAAFTNAHPGVAVVGDLSGQLSNKGERLVLLDAAGNPADEVHYFDGGRWPGWSDGGGSSLELRDPRADNGSAEAWAASREDARAAWRAYTHRAVAQASSVGPDNQWREFVMGMLHAGEVLIDDLRVVEDPDGAAVQLVAGGDFEGGAGGWRFLGHHRHSAVIDDPDNPGNRVLRLSASGPTEHMHNHAEITLAGGRAVQNGRRYEISFRAKWIGGARLLNTRLYFNRVPKTFVLDVPMTNGTPGTVNSTRETNIGPTYSALRHEPAVPAPGASVTVSVRAADPDGVAAVAAWHSVNGGAWQQTSMTPSAGGAYSASISGQAAGAIVHFYVEGTDGLGATSTFPARGRDARALYKVDDGLASPTLNNFRIVMTAADANFMDTDIHLMSNERLGCTVVFDERDVYYDVGVRLKGSERGRVSDGRIGFDVRFHDDDPFLGVHATVGIDRSGLHEMLFNQVMNRAGGVLSKYWDLVKVIAPKNEHTSTAQLQLAGFDDVYLDGQFENGGEGTEFEYELIYYPTTANAEGYKLPSPDGVAGTVINDKGDDREHYRWPFLIKNRRAYDDYGGLIAFAKVFGLTGAAFNSQVGDVIDVDQWLRYMAYAAADASNDTYPTGSNRHNTWFYVRPSDGRLLFFPHDMDFEPSSTLPLVPNTDLAKLIGPPDRERLYYVHMLDILNTAYNTAYMQSWSDRFQALVPGGTFPNRLAFIGARHNFLMSQLAGRVAPEYPFAVTTPDSAVDALSIELQGQGWIDVKEVYIEGRRDPLELTWTASGTGTSRTYFWSVTVALDPGPNTFTLLACDVQGRLVGSDSVTVTSTREARPLRDGLRVTELMYAPRGGGDYEFVEFRNAGPDVLDLTGVRFTDGIEYVFTNGAGSNVAPGEYVVLARDPADFAERYDTAAMNLAGPYAGAFANEGETVRLVDPLGSLIVEFQYADGRGWPLAADGGGHALVPLDRAMDDQPLGSLSYGGNWRAGTYIDGSPGAADPAPIRDARINEVAAHTDLADPAHPLYDSNDWIELFSLTNSPVSLADWYLSDDLDDLRKWAIPATNVLAANGFILFDEVSGFHNPITEGFGLDKAGEQVVLAHLPGTDEDRIVDAVRFKGQENGATLGRQPDGDGAWRALAPTPGAANMPPAGGLVIREFVYRPTVSPATHGDATGGAFIRIENPTAAAVALWNDAGPWRIDGGVSFTFPAGTALAAGGSLYVVSFDPADTNRLAVFEATYGLTNGQAAVLGPYSGVLSHRGERIALERPQAGDRTGDGPSWVIVDEVIYFAMDPFAVDLDGIGRGLLRIDPLSDGNDPANWRAMDPSLLLTLRWKLDESSGTTARNSGMGRRHGTLLDLVPGNADGNTPPAWSEGRFGNALEFDGVDDVVRLDEKVVAGFPFTLSAWVRSSAGAGIACAGFIGEVGQNERYYAIGMRDGKGEIAGHIAPHPFARLSAAGVTPIADGEWHHLAGVFLSATDKRLYVDGRLEATLTAPFAFTSSVNRCSIGLCDRPQRDAPWLGRIDDFRVHGIALTEDQLEAAAAEEPATPDEGGDRLPAAWAVEHFGATNAFNGGPSDDWDGDGLDNWGEYVAGTDPTNAASVFMLDIRGAGGVVFVEWTGRVAEGPNYEGMFRYYSLEERGILSAGDWDPVAGHTNLPGANAVLVYSNAAPGGVRFYRAKARLE